MIVALAPPHFLTHWGIPLHLNMGACLQVGISPLAHMHPKSGHGTQGFFPQNLTLEARGVSAWGGESVWATTGSMHSFTSSE